jgi:hypothetical protein
MDFLLLRKCSSWKNFKYAEWWWLLLNTIHITGMRSVNILFIFSQYVNKFHNKRIGLQKSIFYTVNTLSQKRYQQFHAMT